MNILAKAILRRVFDRIDTTAELARLPAVYQAAGDGLVRRIAAAGILRLALRCPAFSVILILSVVAALELPTGWPTPTAIGVGDKPLNYSAGISAMGRLPSLRRRPPPAQPAVVPSTGYCRSGLPRRP